MKRGCRSGHGPQVQSTPFIDAFNTHFRQETEQSTPLPVSRPTRQQSATATKRPSTGITSQRAKHLSFFGVCLGNGRRPRRLLHGHPHYLEDTISSGNASRTVRNSIDRQYCRLSKVQPPPSGLRDGGQAMCCDTGNGPVFVVGSRNASRVIGMHTNIDSPRQRSSCAVGCLKKRMYSEKATRRTPFCKYRRSERLRPAIPGRPVQSLILSHRPDCVRAREQPAKQTRLLYSPNNCSSRPAADEQQHDEALTFPAWRTDAIERSSA